MTVLTFALVVLGIVGALLIVFGLCNLSSAGDYDNDAKSGKNSRSRGDYDYD